VCAAAESRPEAKATCLSRDRFEKFAAAVRSRVPIGDRVQWTEAEDTAAPRRTHVKQLDMTAADAPPRSPAASGGSPPSQSGSSAEPTHARRMFVQLHFDASASSEQAWHLEVRWNMCAGVKVRQDHGLHSISARVTYDGGHFSLCVRLKTSSSSLRAARSKRSLCCCRSRLGDARAPSAPLCSYACLEIAVDL
jgi:hypothetical protein